MLDDAIQLIKVNRDAVATNRGFYYQYLKLLERWLENFVANRESSLFSEVGDDMKEVNDEIIFTQFKCYTATFSLNSKEIKTSLLSFYAQFLAYKDDFPLKFEFVTNTSIGKNEKLLREWIEKGSLGEIELREKYERRITGILQDEIKRHLNVKIGKVKDQSIRENFVSNKKLLIDGVLDNVQKFIDCVIWVFSDLRPERAIEQILSRLELLLGDSKFEGRNPKLLLDVLLSEIYRKSQNEREHDRKLDADLLKSLLEKTDEQLMSIVDAKISMLFQNELAGLRSQLDKIKQTQSEHGYRLEAVEQSLKEKRKIPKNITLTPFLDNNLIIERSDIVKHIDSHFKSARHLNICGEGGMGKSTVAKMFLHQHYEEFDHIIWLDVKQGIVPAIVVNQDIRLNLGLEAVGKDLIFGTFVNILNQIEGHNLIVLDNLTADKLIFQQLASLKNWNILSTSRYKNENCQNHKLVSFSFEQARELFTKYSELNGDDTCFSEFVEYIQFNTLMIELAAKTIANSLDLDISKLLAYLKNQELDAVDLKIDIESEGTADNIQIYSSLLATFALSDLSDNEVFLIQFFSVLPSEEIAIADLIDMAGQSNKSENTPYFINNINQLAKKGWIEKAGSKFSMHRLVQQSIIYDIRKKNSFFVFFFFITWLGARFQEAHKNNPSAALRFLKYGDSILEAIKEPFRNKIYQPLLILENEVLLVYTLFMHEVKIVQKWQSLYERASRFLKEYDPVLGTILSNYGMSLMREDRVEEAESCYLRACEIFKRDEKLVSHLVSTKINLSIVYTEQRDFSKVKSMMMEISELRSKYKLGNDASAILEGNALAHANEAAGNLKSAEGIYQLLSEVFFELPFSQQNILHYAEVMHNYSIVLLKQEKLQKAIDNQLNTIKLLEDNSIGDNVTVFKKNVNMLYMLYIKNDFYAEAEKLKEKYASQD
ncbi:MAG: hypothetical protein DCE86_00265 [Flavobacteriaceae bacterium]|nr:MAG: hypothetical protein DCE86_00265 [Flavobacteriaceae bacterium]